MILLIPATASAWRDRDDYYDERQAVQMQRIADELEYQQKYREYQDQVIEYEEAYPNKNQQNAMKHYYRWPQPPKR